MNKKSSGGGIVSNVMLYVACMVFLLALIAPIFLGYFRTHAEEKFKNFKHKDKLIAEEVGAYRFLLWIVCIVAWVILIVANVQYNTIDYSTVYPYSH
jgi:predicted PurR-regulated permease PerM